MDWTAGAGCNDCEGGRGLATVEVRVCGEGGGEGEMEQ